MCKTINLRIHASTLHELWDILYYEIPFFFDATALSLKKFQRNNFITRVLCFSQLVVCFPFYIPSQLHSISNRTTVPTAYKPLCICVRALHAGGPSLVPDIHENSRVWGRQRGQGDENGRRVHMQRLWFSAHDTLLPIIQRTCWPIVNLSRDGGRLLHPKWSRYVNLHNASIK